MILNMIKSFASCVKRALNEIARLRIGFGIWRCAISKAKNNMRNELRTKSAITERTNRVNKDKDEIKDGIARIKIKTLRIKRTIRRDGN